MKEKLGIIGTADIAYRRFLPALMIDKEIEYIGVAVRDKKKGKKFLESYGGKVYEGYDEIIHDKEITSMYIPLPPALHKYWGMMCLEEGIHVFMEKPLTVNLDEMLGLVKRARETQKVIFENYAFLYHMQLRKIKEMIFADQVLGDLRLIRINFSFPKRSSADFRYNKKLGGGALLDCGGYTIRLAEVFLGKKICVDTAKLNYVTGCDVDLYGTATLQNEKGMVAQIAFGMDNGYKCELEIIGQNGWIRVPRIFTAPIDYVTEIFMNINNEEGKIVVGQDNQFLNAICKYKTLLINDECRSEIYDEIVWTAELMENIRERGSR